MKCEIMGMKKRKKKKKKEKRENNEGKANRELRVITTSFSAAWALLSLYSSSLR
jgi:hypothetical protein